MGISRCTTRFLETPESPLHDLIPLGPALPGALTTAEIDATLAYAEAEKALATRAAYPPGAPPGAPQPCQRTRGS